MAIERENTEFVQTPDLDEAEEVMEKYGLVILCGPPGSGKTTVGNALLRYCSDRGSSSIIISDLKDWHVHVGEGRRSAVLMDGTLGEVCVEPTQYLQWRSLVSSLLTLIERGYCRLVLTIYPHILRKLRDFDEFTASPLLDRKAEVQLMHTRLENNDKTCLLKSHLKQLHLEPLRQQQLIEDILHRDESGSAFLWCCRQMLRKWTVLTDPAAVFTAPAFAYVPLLKRLLHDKQHGSEHLAAVLALSMLEVKHFIHEKELVRNHLQKLEFSNTLSVDLLADCADNLKGLVLDPHGKGFVSRTLYEAAGLVLGHSFRLPLLLAVCDIKFLVHYVHSQKTITGLSISVVCETDRHLLYERFLEEIRNKHLQQISQHPTLPCKRFHQETDEVKHEFVNTFDPVHNMPLLYWAVVGQSTALMNFCLDHLSLMDLELKAMETLLTQVVFAMALLWDDSDTVFKHIDKIEQAFDTPDVITGAVFTVKLPLPALEERLTKKLQCRCEKLLHAAGPSDHALSYARNSSLLIPAELVSVSVDTNTVILDFGGRPWWVALRLLADREVDGKDTDGNTLLHLGAQAGDLQVIAFAIRTGASLTQSNNQHLTPTQTAAIGLRSNTRLMSRNIAKFEELLARIKQNDQEKTKIMLCFNFFVRSPLVDSCLQGRKDVASLLMKLGCDVNAKDYCEGESGLNTPLHIACMKGHRDIAELLLQNHADVNIVGTGDHGTALHVACTTDSLADCEYICRLLIENGADVNAVNRETGLTPLHQTCRKNDRHTAAMLIQHGAELNVRDKCWGATPLHCACARGNKDVAELLVSAKAEVSLTDSAKRTPIYYAYSSHSGDLIRTLEQNGAKLDGLHKAAMRGDTNALTVFSEYGFDMNMTDITLQCSPLHVACTMNNVHTVNHLVKLGADVNALDGAKHTPLYNECVAGRLEMVQALISHGADVNSKDNPLYAACSVDQTNIVEYLVQHGADVNKKKHTSDVWGLAPLHIVCREGFTHAAQFLLQNGADINIRDSYLQTPLHHACINGKLEIARLLIENNADIDAVDFCNDTPLYQSVRNEFCDVSTLLIEHGANVNNSAHVESVIHLSVEKAAWLKQPFSKFVSLLIAHGADVNAVDSLSSTPLHSACRNCDRETVLTLLEHGAQVEKRDNHGHTPLHLAGSSDITQILIEHEADVNAVADDCNMPVHFASQRGDPGSLDILVHHGADINAQNAKTGESPLHLTRCPETVSRLAQRGADLDARDHQGRTLLHTTHHTDVVKKLIALKADVNARDQDSRTPLHSSRGNADKVIELILHGAHIDAEDKDGMTPLYDLCRFSADHNQRTVDIALLFIKRDASVNSTDSSNNTILHRVCQHNFTLLAKLLLRYGANVNASNKEGSTPLHIACRKGYIDTARCLIQHGALLNKTDKASVTPLLIVCGERSYPALNKTRTEMAKLLLEAGACANTGNTWETPLTVACMAGSAEIVKILLSHGAVVNRRLTNSMGLCTQEIVQLLTEHNTCV